MNRDRMVARFISRSVANLENTRYVKQALKEHQVERLEALPPQLQLSIEREAAYLRGFLDGIRLARQ